MTTTIRRFLAIGGAIILGASLGDAADAAGVTPLNDGDMAVRGLVAGLGLGLSAMAFVRGDQPR